ncbi:MAG: hypothetical protein NUW37_17485 [Planctomycetes bacterium]|nr:hypothetical protein [Planctomycetota bacterium]
MPLLENRIRNYMYDASDRVTERFKSAGAEPQYYYYDQEARTKEIRSTVAAQERFAWDSVGMKASEGNGYYMWDGANSQSVHDENGDAVTVSVYGPQMAPGIGGLEYILDATGAPDKLEPVHLEDQVGTGGLVLADDESVTRDYNFELPFFSAFGEQEYGNVIPDGARVLSEKEFIGPSAITEDRKIDVYDFGARLYDHSLGRFLIADPLITGIGLTGFRMNPFASVRIGSMNFARSHGGILAPFQYVSNNPANLFDPLGLQGMDAGAEQIQNPEGTFDRDMAIVQIGDRTPGRECRSAFDALRTLYLIAHLNAQERGRGDEVPLDIPGGFTCRSINAFNYLSEYYNDGLPLDRLFKELCSRLEFNSPPDCRPLYIWKDGTLNEVREPAPQPPSPRPPYPSTPGFSGVGVTGSFALGITYGFSLGEYECACINNRKLYGTYFTSYKAISSSLSISLGGEYFESPGFCPTTYTVEEGVLIGFGVGAGQILSVDYEQVYQVDTETFAIIKSLIENGDYLDAVITAQESSAVTHSLAAEIGVDIPLGSTGLGLNLIPYGTYKTTYTPTGFYFCCSEEDE